jgi:hypothetical protein
MNSTESGNEMVYNGPRRNLDEELSFWGNTSDGGLADSWWKRDLMVGWEDDDGQNTIPGAYPAIKKLHKLGVTVLRLLTEITQTRLTTGYSKHIRHYVASKNQRWNDVEKLDNGTDEEKWEVINRWASILREFTPSIRIILYEHTETQERCYIIQKRDRVSKRLPPKPNPPPGTRPINQILGRAYPDRRYYDVLGRKMADEDQLNWIGRQIIRIGLSKRHRRSEREVQQCALKLHELVVDEIGQPRHQELGVLLWAAFPEYFRAGIDPGNSMMKLLQRARAKTQKPGKKRRKN